MEKSERKPLVGPHAACMSDVICAGMFSARKRNVANNFYLFYASLDGGVSSSRTFYSSSYQKKTNRRDSQKNEPDIILVRQI